MGPIRPYRGINRAVAKAIDRRWQMQDLPRLGGANQLANELYPSRLGARHGSDAAGLFHTYRLGDENQRHFRHQDKARASRLLTKSSLPSM